MNRKNTAATEQGIGGMTLTGENTSTCPTAATSTWKPTIKI